MSILIFSTIYSDPLYVANSFKSSQQTLFPSSNAYNIEKRLKTWRSAGYFNIESGSNTFVFRETIGVDLTATIAVDEYASDALFFAAVKLALENAGASTYTVSRDTTTNRIKIVSDGLGGGGIFQLICTDAGSAAIFGILGYSTAANRTGALTHEADVLKIHTEEFLKWDLGVPTNPTGFFAVANRNVALNISPTAVIKLQGNWTDNWSAPAVDYTLTPNEFIISKIDSTGLSPLAQGYRYWRLYIQDQDNPDGYIELGAVALCGNAVITRGCPAFPFVTELQDRTNVVYSEGGQTISGRRSKTQTFRLDWRLLDNASMESLEQHYNYFGQHSSFFVAFDPNEVFSSDSDTWIRLVRFDADPQPSLVTPGNWSMAWSLREEL